MIETVTDMLKAFADSEATKLAASPIKHAPTIGGMYEGLTRAVLEQALPAGFGLQMVNGFVIDDLGQQSGQIDGMLVRGTGEPIEYMPGSYRWHVKDVIAVFEVKKNLFGADLADAHDQMRQVQKTFSAWLQQVGKGQAAPNLNPTYRAFAEVTGMAAPRFTEWPKMPQDQHLILHSFMHDQLAPIRIVFGYGGFSSEYGLRKGFVKHLEALINVQGYGPATMPNLIVAGGAALVKLSGHPYRAPLEDDGYLPLMASARANPMRLILELIWTRLSYSAPLATLFGDDLDLEVLAPLLSAKPITRPDQPDLWGWMYKAHPRSKASLAKLPAMESWEPVVLSTAQYSVVRILLQRDIDLGDPEFEAFVAGEGEALATFVQALCDTNLVAVDNNHLILTTSQCGCAVLPDGRFVAGEDNTGRMTRWLARQAARPPPPSAG